MGKYFVAVALVLFGVGVCLETPVLLGLTIGGGVACLWLGVYNINEEEKKKKENSNQ